MHQVSFSRLGKYGRLGNQLFQIAATYAYALKYKHKFVIPLWEYSEYFSNISKYQSNDFRYYNRQQKPMLRDNDGLNLPYVYGDVELFGYFQSLEYFKNYQDQIKELFKHNIILNNIYNGEKWLFVHVRRGDYCNLENIYVDLYKTNYYSIIDNIKTQYDDIIILTDDVKFCKNKFPNYKIQKSENEIVDLLYMTKGDVVMSNSTFSWWGSYLNSTPNKKIYAPKKWFNNHLSEKDLYRDDMILI